MRKEKKRINSSDLTSSSFFQLIDKSKKEKEKESVFDQIINGQLQHQALKHHYTIDRLVQVFVN